MPTPVLLHSCCAPCSSAILEWLLANDYAPTVFFYNPNIFPEEEYLRRKEEAVRYCKELELTFIDGDYEHDRWREAVRGLENEPERGARCAQCFGVRMAATAACAQKLGIELFTTTLAGSRWKRFEQIEAAALAAQAAYPGTRWWNKDWKKGGLQERKRVILIEKGFYNQQWCGCEFSLGHLKTRDPETLPEYVRPFIDFVKPEASE